jgi:prephenate dehydrogenase
MLRRARYFATSMPQLFKQMTVCGVGLIGGSLAIAARRHGLVGRIVGLGRSQENLDVALERGIVDDATRDPIHAARGADLIVLAVPIVTMRETLAAMVGHCAPDAVVTDVGSVKGWVVRALEPILAPGMALVAAHPIAGKETTGAGAADEALFVNRRVIITPSAMSTAEAIEKIEKLWQASGARVERMDPDLHDQILARASHLPQAVSTVLAAALSGEQVGGVLAAEYGAGGLRDTTRLAASSWEMWRDIFATNRDAIAAALKIFGATFAEFQRMVETDDVDGLKRLFNRGRALKERIG